MTDAVTNELERFGRNLEQLEGKEEAAAFLRWVNTQCERRGIRALVLSAARPACGGSTPAILLAGPSAEPEDRRLAANLRLAEAERRNFEARMAEHRERMAAWRTGR